MNRSVLIVDDEKNVRLTFRACLEVEGYVVSEASDGAEALEQVLRNPPDVMLLDLRMPAPDGLAVLERLIQLGLQHRPQVIVMTAHGTIQSAKRAIQLGAFDFIDKPATPEVLRSAVAEAIKAKEPLVPQSKQITDAVSSAREAIANGDMARGEELLMKAHDLHEGDPEYLNLVGVVHELNHRWDQAHRYYGKAVHRKFAPAQMNLRRLYELENFGSSKIAIEAGSGIQIPIASRKHSER